MKPWEKYAAPTNPAPAGPWAKYAAPAVEESAVTPKPEAAPEPTVTEAFFPRATRPDASAGQKVVGAALDAFSLPGRFAAASSTQRLNGGNDFGYMGAGAYGVKPEPGRYESVDPKGPSFRQSMAETEGKTLAGKVIRDPALLPSLALGGPAANLAGKGLAAGARALGLGSRAAPVATQAAGRLATAGRIVTGIGAKAGKAALQGGAAGAIEGTASAAIHQVDNAAQGREVDLGDAATEIAFSAVLPAVVGGSFSAAKETGKEAAKGIMQTALKPDKRLLQGRGSKLDMQQIFDMNLDSPRGLEAMDEKIKAFRDNVKANYGELLAENAGRKFNIRGALSQAIQEVEGELGKFKNADQVEGIKKGIQYWKDYLANTSLNVNNGWMPIEDVASLRAGVWGAAKFNQASPAGYAEFAEKFGHKINEQLGNRLPEARALDAKLAKTRPMEQATEDAIRRTGNNRYIGLTDAIGLGAAGAGSAFQGDAEGAIPGLGIALGARALRSPAAASLLYRGSNRLPAMEAASPLMLGGRRIIGGSMREEEEVRRK